MSRQQPKRTPPMSDNRPDPDFDNTPDYPKYKDGEWKDVAPELKPVEKATIDDGIGGTAVTYRQLVLDISAAFSGNDVDCATLNKAGNALEALTQLTLQYKSELQQIYATLQSHAQDFTAFGNAGLFVGHSFEVRQMTPEERAEASTKIDIGEKYGEALQELVHVKEKVRELESELDTTKRSYEAFSGRTGELTKFLVEEYPKEAVLGEHVAPMAIRLLTDQKEKIDRLEKRIKVLTVERGEH